MVTEDLEVFQLKLPSSIENLFLVEELIDKAKEKYHIKDDVYGNVVVAITEAVNNAIVHGNANDANKNVYLSLSLEAHTLKCVVEDQGKGFDYENLPDPTAPENLHKIGGRGVFLIRHLSDSVEFLDGGKKIVMCFKV